MRILHPDQELAFPIAPFNMVFAKNSSLEARFSVTIAYDHPETGTAVRETVDFDMEDYVGTSDVRDSQEEAVREISRDVAGIKRALEGITRAIEAWSSVKDPTGLSLSITTMERFRHAFGAENVLLIDPTQAAPGVFCEVLGVDYETAIKLYKRFREGPADVGLDTILTPAQLALLHRHFVLPP